MSHDQDQVAALAAAWIPDLRRTGGVRVHFDADRALYRAAARQAARILDRPVQTTTIGTHVHVLVSDWTERPLERQLEDARTRNAIDAAFATPDEPPAPRASVTPLRPER
ncbi:hypothetical protein OG979_20265 [Actinomadura citrea]|uniref:hypothetical protein n=1 Tax=Actinomadura citrea TaxID=46158 RepID=UPI002E296C00|nr:hypothetical protein [Actinomadura citrea]